MTIIAYRDGVLCADSQTNIGHRKGGRVQKIARSPDGSIGGASGDGDLTAHFVCWIEAGAVGTAPPALATPGDGLGVLVRPSGAIFYWWGRNDLYPVEDEFLAIGAGDDIAIGAMAMGASARQAVEIAITWNRTCGGPVQELCLSSNMTSFRPFAA